MIKYVSLKISFWSIFFWMAVGSCLLGIIFLIIHHPHLREKAKLGVKHLVVNGILSSLALLSLLIAIAHGPVSLISALMVGQPLLVLIVASLLTYFSPYYIAEKISPQDILLKVSAALIIIVGGVIILY